MVQALPYSIKYSKICYMYFITAICNDSRSDYFRDRRCFGYYALALDAIKAVTENRGDMHECLYDYLVIERVPQGIHAMPESEIWFRWNDEQNTFVVTEKPDWSQGYINWSIG